MEQDYDGAVNEAERLQIDIEQPALIEGAGYGLIFSIAVTKDILDLFFLMLSLLFAVTGVGVVVTIIISTIKFLISLIIALVIWFYFFFKRVKFTTRIFIRLISMLIIELLPIINSIPMASITVASVRSLENKRRTSVFVDGVVESVAKLSGRL